MHHMNTSTSVELAREEWDHLTPEWLTWKGEPQQWLQIMFSVRLMMPLIKLLEYTISMYKLLRDDLQTAVVYTQHQNMGCRSLRYDHKSKTDSNIIWCKCAPLHKPYAWLGTSGFHFVWTQSSTVWF